MRHQRVVVLVLLVMARPGAAQLLWGDDFDNRGVVGSPSGPYVQGPVGTFGASSGGLLSPTNGAWDAWAMNPAADGGIDHIYAHSRPHSIEIGGPGSSGSGCDVVQWHAQATVIPGNPGQYNQLNFSAGSWPRSTAAGGVGGVWQYRAWNYIPSSFPTGTSAHYFIVNDMHNNFTGGQSSWIMQIQFNHISGTVSDDFRPSANPVQIVYDQWMELVATFDLENQCVSATYSGNDIGHGVLFVPPYHPVSGTAQLANLDLFTLGATSYWDDITLTRLGFTLTASTRPGQGNLQLSLTGIPQGTIHGWTLVSDRTPDPVGGGPSFFGGLGGGLYPSGLSVRWLLDTLPSYYPSVSSVSFWTWPVSSPLYPACAFTFPPGSFPSSLHGTRWDFVGVAFIPGNSSYTFSNIVRMTW